MEYSFRYSVRPANLWVLSMMNIYRSMMGVVNIVFTLSMVLLALRFWAEAGPAARILIAAGGALFPLLQPLMIFLRSRKIVGGMPAGMLISFSAKGMTVTAGEEKSHVDYWDLKSVIRISGMLIIYTRSRQGFILNRQALGGKEKELYGYLKNQVKK